MKDKKGHNSCGFLLFSKPILSHFRSFFQTIRTAGAYKINRFKDMYSRFGTMVAFKFITKEVPKKPLNHNHKL